MHSFRPFSRSFTLSDFKLSCIDDDMARFVFTCFFQNVVTPCIDTIPGQLVPWSCVCTTKTVFLTSLIAWVLVGACLLVIGVFARLTTKH